MKPESLVSIFGSNLLEDYSLEKSFRELTGIDEVKPFECVGTIDEVNLALKMTVEMYPTGELPYLLQMHYVKSLNDRLTTFSFPKLQQTGSDHFVPAKYVQFLESWFA